jgi:threonine 3-dehydrogenase
VHDDISSDIAAILDPFGNAVHCALSFDITGEDVLITGAGPIGIMAATVCRFIGARHVVISDINPFRLQLAETMGIKHTVDAANQGISEMMQSLHISNGFDVGLEMSGSPVAFNDLLAVMYHGGNVALLGFLPPQTEINWDTVIFKGLHLKGVYGREVFETWYKMTQLLRSGLDISAIISHRFPVNEYHKAFDVVQSGECGKVIIDWEA